MKKVFIVTVFFLVNIFCIGKSYAQMGWQWVVTGNPLTNDADVNECAIDGNGNVYMSMQADIDTSMFGSVVVYNPGTFIQIVVTKTDSSGNCLWGIGTQYADVVENGMAIDKAGNAYLFCSYVADSIGIGPVTLYNPALGVVNFLAKLSPAGNVIWAKNINVVDNTTIGVWGSPLGDIDADAAGNVYLSSVFYMATTTLGSTTLANANTGGGTSDIFLAKYDSSGNVVWANRYGSANNEHTNVLKVSDSGNLYLAGTYQTDIPINSVTLLDSNNFIAKFNNNGTPLWADNMNRPLVVNGMTTDASEHLYVTGYTTANTIIGADTLLDISAPGSGTSFFLVKYNADGVESWAKGSVDAGSDQGFDVATDNCGQVWVSGGAWTTQLSFNGHILPIPNYTGNSDGMYILSYDSAGHYLSGMGLNGGGDDQNYIMPDNAGNFYLAGDYMTNPFYIGTDTFYVDTLFGMENSFLAKYGGVYAKSGDLAF